MRLLVAVIIGVAGACLLAPGTASAQATRTWVSGVGDDANPCSRTAPCKTFAGAISKTAVWGEINCLDPGGFGALTITKSIAIKCDENPEAGVLVAGTNGFVIQAATTDVVWISGLDFEGLGPNSLSLNGIKIITVGNVTVSECQLRGFGSTNGTDGNGIFMTNSNTNAKLFVIDSIAVDNANVGIAVKPGAGTTTNVQVSRSQASNNAVGMRADGTGSATSINMTVNASVATQNSGSGIAGVAGPATLQMMIDSSDVSYNGVFGLNANGALIRFGGSTLTGNGTATTTSSGGIVNSYGNNQINGNGVDTTPPTIPLH